MATIQESVLEMMTPPLTDEWGKTIGVDGAEVKEGVGKAAPVILAAVGKTTEATKGADELLASLKQDDSSAIDAIADGRGYEILQQLFGVGVDKVASWLKDTTEIDIGPFLPVAAPLVMRALHNAVTSRDLDSAETAALVKTENDSFTKQNRQLSSEIAAALDAGENVNERAAELRARFEPEEWNTLTNVPTLAGYAVMASAWSGPRGITHEMNALVSAAMETAHTAGADTLVGLVSRNVTDPMQVNELGVTREDAAAVARDACLDALRILNEKAAHDDIVAYKEFVITAATRVACAINDGGIFGWGGKPISKEEQQTLDLIAASLAYEA